MNGQNPLTILLYHGVTREKSFGIENVSGKHIQAKEFEKQMQYLKKNASVLSMDEVYEIYHRQGTFPEHAVAVTFDDGFKNNYTEAAPILSDAHIPATFYLSSGVINTDLLFWVDIIEAAINQTKERVISITLESQTLFDLSTQAKKIDALLSIKDYCKKSLVPVKDRVFLDVIRTTKTEPTIENAKNYQKLSWNEVKELDRNPLFTIGGHSLYHDILTRFTDSKKVEEDIHLTLHLLKYHLGHDVHHFSYPEGQQDHYNEEIIETLKKLSVKICPSAIDGINDPSSDLFHLRRIMVGFNGKPFPVL